MTKWITGVAFILTGTSVAWAGNLDSSIGGGLDDRTITADVTSAIAQHRDLGPPNEISVDTRDHVVYLSGMVFNSLSGEDAEAIARQVPGVTRVVATIGVDE